MVAWLGRGFTSTTKTPSKPPGCRSRRCRRRTWRPSSGGIDAFNRGDIDAFLEGLDAEVECHWCSRW